MLISIKRARKMLPKVGDKMARVPTLYKSPGMTDLPLLPCVVDYVNVEHLWYRVRFESGLRECYKVPELETRPKGRPRV